MIDTRFLITTDHLRMVGYTSLKKKCPKKRCCISEIDYSHFESIPYTYDLVDKPMVRIDSSFIDLNTEEREIIRRTNQNLKINLSTLGIVFNYKTEVII